MTLHRHSDFNRLEREWGIVLPSGPMDYIKPDCAHDLTLAMDAQPALVTTSNAGIPAFLSNFVDPKLIQVLTTPNKAAQILGEVKKGDWTSRTAMFPVVESTGEVSSYGDWNTNGSVGANVEFPQRQSYHYQTITEWGERQLATAGLAKIDWANRLNIASALILDKFQNLTYFFGVEGLENYGLLNDPSLSPAITPGVKADGGGTGWQLATPNEVFADIQALFAEAVAQAKDLINAESKCVLALSPGSALYLTNANSFNVNVYDQLKKNFPNMRFETAVQYATAAGNMAQLIFEEVEGQDTGFCAFTEKMRAHPLFVDLSSFKQKKSQGTWGAVITQPFAIATMIGI